MQIIPVFTIINNATMNILFYIYICLYIFVHIFEYFCGRDS